MAIVPRFSVQREQEAGTLAVLTLTDFGAPRSVGALTPRAFAPTHAARAFLELAHAHTPASRAGAAVLGSGAAHGVLARRKRKP